jgi:predicted TIM-barrel fold metal-dependent hydrolase
VNLGAPSIPYFDCDTFIGRDYGNRNLGGYDLSPEDLVDEMDRVGIAKAAVYHVLAKEYHPSVGNPRLSSALSGHSRLVPIWVVMPHHTDEVPGPDELVRQMRAGGVRMARMFPGWSPQAHRYSLAEWCVGELLGALEGFRIPVQLDFTLFRRDEPPWRDIYEVCNNHPRLPLILVDIQGRNNRTLYALLERFDNIYIHTAGLNVHQGLEDICRRFGPERLVFGSGYPVKYLGGAYLQVERSGLSHGEKQLVASGNLERLLASVEMDAVDVHAR